MSKELNLEETMKEDAFIFDALSKEICQPNKNENIDYELLLERCKKFEDEVVLFNIIPSFYVIKTILYFKLNDYENANIYIHASLKYLVFVAKNGLLSSEKEQKNFEEYKNNVINQYKILIQDKPEYQKKTKVSLPLNVKYITSKDEAFIDKEIQKRVKIRQSSN
ncbi:MAG: hypothetical protein HRT43_01155 [Campylobacteraceae bacterium]|nr:hypothetical protein [Campylobacteraceae bacterium]